MEDLAMEMSLKVQEKHLLKWLSFTQDKLNATYMFLRQSSELSTIKIPQLKQSQYRQMLRQMALDGKIKLDTKGKTLDNAEFNEITIEIGEVV